MASTLVVLKFDTPEGADEGLAIAAKLQREHLLEIQDIATVTWPEGKKKPKTHHGQGACGGAWYGAFWGMLIGFIFFVPFLAPPGRCDGRAQRIVVGLRYRQRFH